MVLETRICELGGLITVVFMSHNILLKVDILEIYYSNSTYGFPPLLCRNNGGGDWLDQLFIG